MRSVTIPFRTNRLYYGWIIVAALAVTELTSWGVQYYAFAVFLGPMGADLRWSQALCTRR